MSLLKEFLPALLFVGKFVGFYIIGNLLYGLWIESYKPEPDPMTRTTTTQTASVLKLVGYEAEVSDNPLRPTVFLKAHEQVVISVFEGCNGINVMIVFIAFVFAYQGKSLNIFVFIIAGLIIIHFANLARIGLLYYIARFEPDFFYYFHKYLFTAILYVVVFSMWILWVARFNGKQKSVA
jgi:exosortase family protein XrtF